MKVFPFKNISLIAAMTGRRVIGLDNTLPWSLPEDLKLFKRTTMGNILIMGRKTFESIGKPLPGRRNFVVSASACKDAEVSSGSYENGKLCYFRSLEDALSAAGSEEGEPYIIGGASIYTQALPYTDILYLSIIKKEYDGNVYFPDFDRSAWFTASEEDFGDFVLNVLKRKI